MCSFIVIFLVTKDSLHDNFASFLWSWLPFRTARFYQGKARVVRNLLPHVLSLLDSLMICREQASGARKTLSSPNFHTRLRDPSKSKPMVPSISAKSLLAHSETLLRHQPLCTTHPCDGSICRPQLLEPCPFPADHSEHW